MKKKVLCFALTVVMGLSMSTCAFAKSPSVAKIGSGDVNGDGERMADDCAAILQYTLDSTYADTHADTFNLNEANYDGDMDPSTGYDRITANDSAVLLQDVLYPITDIYITVEAGKQNPVKFSEVINPYTENGFEETKVLDFVDTIMGGAYDTELTNNAGKVNTFIDKIEFTGNSGQKTNIRTDIGWSKFANAVSGVVTDEAAFAELENSVKTKKYATAEDIKADYETAKKAFAPSMAASAVSETGAKITEITGPEFVTVSKVVTDENGNEVLTNTMNIEELCKVAADNNLQAYDTVTINQLQEIFGSKMVITAKNTSNGYENQVKVTIERR